MTFKYKWYVNDLPVAGNSDSLVLTGVKKGSWVHVSVTPNDGFADGAWKDSPRYQVVNALPVVKSALPKELPPGRRFIYRIVAEDPDGDPLTYTLTKAPPGMVLRGETLEWQVPEESHRSQRGGGGSDLRQRRGPDSAKHLDDDPTAEMTLGKETADSESTERSRRVQPTGKEDL